MSHQTRKSTSAKKTQGTSVRKKTATKKRKGWSDLSKNVRYAVIILIALVSVSAVLLGVYYAQLVENPFEEGDSFSFKITFNQGSGEAGNLDLYYYNSSGKTNEEIQEFLSNQSNFVDYFEIPFLADGEIDEITANASYYYRYYVQPANYTGSFGYVTLGLNEIYLRLLPTSLSIDVTSLTFGHTLENTTETNWTCTYAQSGHAFNTWYNKTGNENITWVFKFDFDVPALDTFVDIEWYNYENQNTIETIDGNSLYVEIHNYAFNSNDEMNFKFFDEIGTTANVTRLGIGYGNALNYVELGSHS